MTHYRYNELREIGIPYTRHTINVMARAGRFPQPRKLLNGTLRWDAAEITAWLAGRPPGAAA
jgi:predicted DNA-binding transcriptional regulator AlpA